ncbi:hypothetical protein EBL89_03510 [Cereibacter sphaeroides]|uniref:hypothetical protein n=1 Tax=Cereibacter sphaeroides TaxID=1063 RepID=UPI000F5338E0|nr:hypothetical protein [Cereibacter sphaeroides]AZB54432.1 hypothetical protein EBL89_03510 [Cereibacter sphaeroides]AZB58685.1 hypothetical protein EBL88_03490 [Cereibacter sphaeroides]
MTRTSPPQVAFSSGELDPLLHRRFDYQRFQTGLAKCQGFLPLAQGGVTRAPGTIWRGRTRNDARCVLVPFTFAANDSCILEFTPLRMRVWRYGALVMSGGSPYELVTPYDETSLSTLAWVQSADVLYMVDGIQPMQRLARLALNNWTIGNHALNSGPFRTQNLNKGLTLQAAAPTGTSVALTANSAFFTANHVGMLIKLEPTDQSTIELWAPDKADMVVGDLRRYGGNIYRLASGNDSGLTAPIHDEGIVRTETDTSWEFVSDSVGVVRVLSVSSPTSALVNVIKTVPRACVDSPTYRWSEGAWSRVYGYPAAIEIYEQRLAGAATPSEPRTVWFSAVGDFSDFDPGTEDDDAFAYTVAGGTSVNRIINLARGAAGLHILALGEEYSTRAETRSSVIGPKNAVFGLDSAVGSSPAKPIAPGGDPMFISRDRKRLLEIVYALDQDRPVARVLSRTAQHIGAAGFEQIVWQAAPEPTAWLRLSTGDLVAMVYDRDEEVLGWAPIPVAGGYVDAMGVYPAAGGGSDILMLAIVREIDGVTVRSIEELAVSYGVLTGAQEIYEACHLYAAAVFASMTPAATFAVPHLAGITVFAWTEQGEFGPIEVPAGGSITLPVAVTNAIIGLFDDSHYIETLDVQAAAGDGNTMGRRKRLHSGMGVGLHRTAQGFVEVVERDFAQPERISARQTLVPRQVASVLTEAYTGVATATAPTGHAKELAVRIRPQGGAPLTVTAIVPIVQEAGS